MSDKLCTRCKRTDQGTKRQSCEKTDTGEWHALVLATLDGRRRARHRRSVSAQPSRFAVSCRSTVMQWEGAVTSFIAGCIAAILIAIVGAVILDQLQQPASVAYSTTAVRL
jgi:hypothetical protein